MDVDGFFAWLQSKIGPMTFGAVLGFVLQVLIFRPTNWMLALERAAAAIVMPVLFSKPFAALTEKWLPGIDRETAVTLAAGLLALGGIELLRATRARLIKTAEGKNDV